MRLPSRHTGPWPPHSWLHAAAGLLLLVTLGLGASLTVAGRFETAAALADSDADREPSIVCSLAPALPRVPPAHAVDAQSLLNSSPHGTRYLPADTLLPADSPRRLPSSTAPFEPGCGVSPQGRRSHIVLHVLLI